MRSILFFSIFVLIFNQTWSQTVDNPPADVSFIIGATSGAPAAGTNKLVLLGIADWDVRLYRGRLKQPKINDGSGIYYTKNAGSDTVVLHGDTWHTGELVQLEFYKPNGSLELGAQYVIQQSTWVKVAEWGVLSSAGGPGVLDNDAGGWPYYTTKKFTGNGYFQFRPVYQWGGALWMWIEDESENSWNLEYSNEMGIKVHYNETLLTTLSNNLLGKYFRLRRNGTTITLESCSTENGVYVTEYTFSQSCSASAGLIGGGFSTGPDNGADNCKLAGQTLVVVYN